MNKHYMPMLVMAALMSIGGYGHVNAQAMPEFIPFSHTPIYSWNTAPYQSYQYAIPGASSSVSPMRFRLMTPNGFNRFASDGKKYPIIIFLHGSGEAGAYDNIVNNGVGEQDNEKQLVHGGQLHMNAVLNGTFPGLLFYPQIRRPNPVFGFGPAWGFDNIKAVEYILRKLILDYKVDPDRIYIHGLSMGGEGAWRFISWKPDLFAAAHPMSAAGTAFWKNQSQPSGYWTGEARHRYKHIPLRHAQGALDQAPLPTDGNNQVDAVREVGGNIRYSYYSTLGHGTWNSEYSKPDFFSWFLSQRKNTIHVAGGQTSFCPGENFSATLGLSPGFANYQWVKNDTTSVPFATGATVNEVIITQAVSAGSGVGKYYARFQRANGLWTRWSAPVDINSNKGLSSIPEISTNNQSRNLPSLDGTPDVPLTGTFGKAAYVWKRDVTTLPNTTQSINVSTAGTYVLRTRDAGGTGREANGMTPTEFRAEVMGCLSPASNPVVITTQNGVGVPAPPANFFAGANSTNSIKISWDDRSSTETGFELYRSTSSGNGYKLIAILPASSSPNPQSYSDGNLQANVTYYYRLRSVNDSGGSAYTPEAIATTAVDVTPPSAPVLTLGLTSRTEINLSWSGATDNVGVFEYDIYQNNVLITSTTQTSYRATGVVAFATYSYTVKARDLAGNPSTPSNQVTVGAVNAGLSYSYYEHANLTSTTQITTAGILVKTGVSPTFSIAPRNRNDGFAFIFDGYLIIPANGSYTFSISSDDGGVLYVNNVLAVSHDGTHSCSERTGSAMPLSAGTYPIRCLMFSNSGGECLTVRWQGPGISKTEIPNTALKDTYTPPAALTSPSNFSAAAAAFNQINLTWNDNSNNETGFEVSRALSASGPFQVVKVTASGATSWSDNTLDPSTQYYYTIRTINANSASAAIGPVDATTNAAPPPPAAPANLAAVANTPLQVTLTWTDNSNNESGFEIQRSSQPGTGFVSIATTAANAVSFIDTQANGHSTLYYRIRALRNGGVTSAFTSETSVATGNRNPVIGNIIDRCIAIGSTMSFEVLASDPDVDPLNFTFPNGLPSFASFQSDGFGKGKVTFTNAVAGTYTIRVQASDGLASVFDDFILTVNTNNSPVLADIPFQATEEGRTLLVTASATDLDATDVLTYTVSALPSFATWNTYQRRLTFKPLAGHAGTYSVTVTVKDNKVPAGVDTRTFTLVVAPIDDSYTIAVNFTTAAAQYEGAPWNNTGLPTATDITNLKDDTNTVVRFVSLNTGTSWTTTAPQTIDLPASPAAVFTEKVRETYYRKSSGGTGITMRFKGLNPAMQYKLTFFGAGGWIGGTPPANLTVLNTRYVVTGLTSQQLEINTINNSSTTATTGFIKPTVNGEIAIAVMRGTDNINHYYINALLLSGFFDDGSIPDAPSTLTLTAPSYDTVRVSWKDNSVNETRFDILRAASLSGPYTIVGTVSPNVTSFSDVTTAGRTSYYYKVRAAGTGGSADSNPQLVTTPNGLPVITAFPAVVVTAGQTVQRSISATDPEGDPVIFSALNLPSFATLVDNGNGTGYIQFAPQSDDISTSSFTLQATDNFSGQSLYRGTVISPDPQYDEIVYLNFIGTGTTSHAASPWNNVQAFNNANSLATITGTASSIQLKTGTGWTGSSNSAGVSTDNGLYPDNVNKSFWSTSSTTTGATVVLKGLNNSKRYNLTLSGSLNEFWFANSIYEVNGIQKTLNTSKNTTETVKFSGIQPTGDSILINLRKGPNIHPNPVVAQRDGILGAMVVEVATPGASPLRPSNLVAEGISKTAIRLRWTDNSSDETGFEIYRATAQSGPFSLVHTTAANAETFTNSGLLQNKPYLYRVRAIKAGGSSAYTRNAYASTFEQVILINVNSSAASGHLQAPVPWNNLATPPSDGISFANFKDDTNTATTVDLDLLTWENGGTNNTGYATGNNSGVYPDAVLENYYYFEQFDAATTYQLSGLNNSRAYDLVFLGNEWTVASIGNVKVATDFTVGSTTVSQFNGRNSTQTSSIKQIQPDANAIAFEIKGNDEARYGVWNALEVRSYAPLSATFDILAPTTPQALAASNITNTSVRLTWRSSSDNVTVSGYEVYRGSTLAATVTDTTTTIGGLLPSTAYVFSVRAMDAIPNRSSFSNGLRVTTSSPSGRIAVAEQEVSEQRTIRDVELYPNPVKDKLRIKLPSSVGADENVAIHIYSMQGLRVGLYTTRNHEDGIEISTLAYANGLYILNIDVRGQRILRKFVKE
jgi:chitodextrinase/predicted esterase